MKYLIACLGNIGAEYANTRHNIGFRIGDALAAEAGVQFEDKRYGSLAELRHKGRTLILLKPSTYMNASGEAVRYWFRAKKIASENLLVVLDDINLEFGKLRLRSCGSDGGHNGLRSIDLHIETQAYPRLRFGVGSNFNPGCMADYVLGEWSSSESLQLPALIARATEAVKKFVFLGFDGAVSTVNARLKPPQ